MTARAWHSLGDWQVGRVDGAWVVLSRSKIVEGRGGDRLLARGMSVPTAERIARLLNEDDRRSIDMKAMASGLSDFGGQR